ncbi:unnamed protein product [Adineta ricciae]|uniref:Uncharacterized protein n=1 Tax=Adineta ricciae TaxID=249248 RepID=A0A815MQ96_ADIRI|nr:unnamed protein product [Adineta ricciae]
MSKESCDIPTISINDNEMKDLLKYLYKNESLLKEYGGIKLIPSGDFRNNLKKTSINLSSCSTIQQVKQIDNDNLIYSIKTIPLNENQQIERENCLIDDQIFWLLLPNGCQTQNLPSISSIPNQSLFLKRVQRNQLDFHQLPYQSLLKLCGKKFCKNHYSSTLSQAHGSASIFPLSSNKQDLYQFNYHYQGGIRYWYIIPFNERIKLEHLMKENYSSICFEHTDILVDPLLFNKYNIKYNKVVQHPNEILILSSGILSQSFTQNEILSESIHFALPNWFYDHLTSNSFLSYHFQLSSNLSKEELIDFNLFNNSNIEKYIQKYLQINSHQSEDSTSDKDTPFPNDVNE